MDDRDRFALRVRWVATCDYDRVHVVALASSTGRILDVQATSDVFRYDGGTGDDALDALICRRTSAYIASARAVGAVQRWDARRHRRRGA